MIPALSDGGYVRMSGEVEVQRHEHPFLSGADFGDPWIWCAREPLVVHRQRIMPGVTELVDALSGQVLVNLESHRDLGRQRDESLAS